jgi:hypothetical protein
MREALADDQSIEQAAGGIQKRVRGEDRQNLEGANFEVRN